MREYSTMFINYDNKSTSMYIIWLEKYTDWNVKHSLHQNSLGTKGYTEGKLNSTYKIQSYTYIISNSYSSCWSWEQCF